MNAFYQLYVKYFLKFYIILENFEKKCGLFS